MSKIKETGAKIVGLALIAGIAYPLVKQMITNPQKFLYNLGFANDPDDPIIATKPEDMELYKSLRKEVIKHAKYRCEKCQKPEKTLNVYYIVKPKNGGKCAKDNLIALCELCNS